MKARNPSESVESRLREIDALLATGGLEHSRHKRRATKATASVSIPASTVVPDFVGGKSIGRGKTLDVIRVPEWEQYSWLAHGFSTRTGGVSTVYRPETRQGRERKRDGELNRTGELNLGMTASDSPDNVETNRELFLRAVLAGAYAGRSAGAKSIRTDLILLRQIHSGLVHGFQGRKHVPKTAAEEAPLRGDGAIVAKPGRMLGIQTADCFPVLVADARQRIVAAFHAGWRGTLARIVERGVGRMRAEFGSRTEDLTAAIGPGIGRCCYSVGEEVRMEFGSQFAYADALFEEVFDLDPIKQKYPMLFLTARAPGHSNLGPSIHLDLAEANRRQLLDAGLKPEAVHSVGLCTACDSKRFFSYRAEQGFTGRMLSVIGIRAGSV